jgi:tetratricopeptide (TPR) repeat protein
MADNQRIDDLRRRVQKDPASIAFAQLAEECRRAGQYEESIEVCRAGLALHPGYLSARVTLGRALLELDRLDEGQTALELVLKSAPENLAAIRGLAEIYHRRGSLPEALAQYRAALALARNDPDLQQTVAELARKVDPQKPPASDDGLSFEQMASEFLQHSPPPESVVRLKPDATSTPKPDATSELKPDATSALKLDATSAPRLDATSTLKLDASDTAAADPAGPAADPFAFLQDESAEAASPFDSAEASLFDFAEASPFDSAEASPFDSGEASPFDFAQDTQAAALQSEEDTAARQLAMQTIKTLEQWLDAIHVTRAQPIA